MSKSDSVKISVIIPTYNRVNFLRLAIESVLNQKWFEIVGNSWELIIVDDCSKDNTGDIINMTINKFPNNVFGMRSDINRGIAQTLNAGFKRSKGNYVCWLSDDDRWFARKMSVQYPLMLDNPDCILSYSDYTTKDLRHSTMWLSKVYAYKNRQDAIKRLFKDCFINGSTVMIKRDIFDKIGYMSELDENKWNQDLEYWFRILLNYDNIIHIPQSLVFRTNHFGMLSLRHCGEGNDILFPKMMDECLKRGINIL